VVPVGVAVADARGEVAVVDAGRAAVRHREAEVLVDERLQPGVRGLQRRQQRRVPGVEDDVAVAREVAAGCGAAGADAQRADPVGAAACAIPGKAKSERAAASRAKRRAVTPRNRRVGAGALLPRSS
jgi:hypothetical protein